MVVPFTKLTTKKQVILTSPKDQLLIQIGIKQDAQESTVKATGGAFDTGILIASVKLHTLGLSAPASNVPIYSDAIEGQLDFNLWGWPAKKQCY